MTTTTKYTFVSNLISRDIWEALFNSHEELDPSLDFDLEGWF